MKKALFLLLLIASGLSAVAQQIQLRSVDKVECVKSDMTGLKASFSFSTIDAQDYASERGTMALTVSLVMLPVLEEHCRFTRKLLNLRPTPQRCHQGFARGRKPGTRVGYRTFQRHTSP